MRPALQGPGLGFPRKDKGSHYGGRKTKAASAEVWIGPELLQGGSPQPDALQVSIPAWARAGRTDSQTHRLAFGGRSESWALEPFILGPNHDA